MGWLDHAHRIATMTRTVSRVLVDCLAPRPGDRILDLACGAGDPALTLHESVGDGGQVVALDPIAELAEGTQQAAQDRGAHRLAAVRACAEGLPFRPGSFSAASCRFGAMFFQPLSAALSELHRVLEPGGRVALAVWGPKPSNPYFTTVSAALDEAGVPPAPSTPGQPTVFELAGDGVLADALRTAGFAEARVEEVPFEMLLEHTSPDGLLDTQAELSSALPPRLDGADPAAVERARRIAAKAAKDWAREGDLPIPALALVVHAQR
jgi:ubiquinone/menaquinone biosynthesis C-methylase UbiE